MISAAQPAVHPLLAVPDDDRIPPLQRWTSSSVTLSTLRAGLGRCCLDDPLPGRGLLVKLLAGMNANIRTIGDAPVTVVTTPKEQA
jgi:hypothetical protein